MSALFCIGVRKAWLKAWKWRAGRVCVFGDGMPPRVLDVHGYGVEFCDAPHRWHA